MADRTFADTRRRELVPVALGDESADLVVKGGKHVNVHSGEIRREDVAVVGDRIAAVGDVERTIGDETTVIDADGKYVTPGLIEGHLHSYHSYVNGTEFAKLLLRHGTTACADGLYGQAIVGGTEAVEFCKGEIQRTPLKLVFLAPTLAHLQMTPVGIPRTPTGLTIDDLREMLEWGDCYGLEEPTYEPIVDLDEEYLDLVERTVARDKVATGHAALPTHEELSAFVAAGVSTDHEMTTAEGATERARRGMYNLSRHGTGLPNLPETSRAMTEEGLDSRQFGQSGDVRLPGDLLERGCIDENVRASIRNGVDPITAVQTATLNTARALRVDQELGSVAPGKVADLVLVDDLEAFEVDTVLADGEVVYRDGDVVAEFERPEYPEELTTTVNLGGSVAAEDFTVEAPAGRGGEGDRATVRTIEVPDGGLTTAAGEAELRVEDGVVRADPDRDIVKAAMFDRLEASGRKGIAFVEGFGLRTGALGFSYNAVRENVVVIGANDEDMATVVNRIADLQGGVVAAKDGEVLAEVPLPLLGLQSTVSAEEAIDGFAALDEAVERDLGCDRPNPLFGVEFLLCPYPETPGIRISDYGLFDVGEREQLDLFV